jgi:acyl-homoserine lactone acylase PvdQ
VKADLGPYAQANDAFLADLADGSAQYNVNLTQTYAVASQGETAALVGQAFHEKDAFVEMT